MFRCLVEDMNLTFTGFVSSVGAGEAVALIGSFYFGEVREDRLSAVRCGDPV